MKIILICLSVLIIVSLSLNVYLISLEQPEPFVCDRTHMEENMKLWGKVDAIADEETAREIADNIMETQDVFVRSNGYHFEKIIFNDESYEWEVYYAPTATPGYVVAGIGVKISIRKDCGLVTGRAW